LEEMLNTKNPETIDALRRLDYWSSNVSGFYHPSLLSIFGVRYILTPRGNPVSQAGYVLVHSSDADVWENQKVLPRAFVVTKPIFAETDEEALHVLCAADSHFENTAVITVGSGSTVEYSSENQAAGTLLPAEIKRYDAETVEIRAHSPGGGWLVLSDLLYPGWNATVDGKPATIFPGNYLFRAIRIAAGPHNVSFVYHPTSFRLGVILALLGVATIILLVFHTRLARTYTNQS
jgi:hypothetical protein